MQYFLIRTAASAKEVGKTSHEVFKHSEDVGLVLYDDVNQLRYLIDIRSRERTGFTESVVRLAQSVE